MAGTDKPSVKPSVTPPLSNPVDPKVLEYNSMTQGQANAFIYQPKTTDISYLTQTSQPDISAIINSAMQQLVGRNATAQEIQQYGSELLAAERANPGTLHSELQYSQTTSKPLTSVGTETTVGVNPTAFIENLIQGTADAKSYRAATQYFNGMQDVLNSMKGTYRG